MRIHSCDEIREIAKKIKSRELEETKDLLVLQDETGWSTAHYLATTSDRTNWSTDDKDVLVLQNNYGVGVAFYLARYHPTWTTEDLEILSLKDRWGEIVEDALLEERKI